MIELLFGIISWLGLLILLVSLLYLVVKISYKKAYKAGFNDRIYKGF